MTTDQAVNRQADHENLIRELAAVLKNLCDAVIDSVEPGMLGTKLEDAIGKGRAALEKVDA